MSYAVQPILQQLIRSRRGKIALAIACMVFLLVVRGSYQLAADFVLYDAAEAGNSQRVIMALKFGANPNVTDGEIGETALMAAARQGDTATVQALLSGGANVNAVSDYGSMTTPLRDAESYQHPAIVELLKRAGARK